MKGALHAEEIEAARRAWSFALEAHESMSSTRGAILEISQLAPRRAKF